MDQTNLADLYGLDPIPWSRALEALESGEPQKQTPFLATTRPDGRPHMAGVGALWDNGEVFFVSGAGTRKSRNPCPERQLHDLDVAVRHRPRHRGQGEARDRRCDAPATCEALRRPGLARHHQGRLFTYDYSAPSAGPPPWDLFAITPTTVFGVLTVEPGGATRWRFDA
jgi:hypothetical protein